MGSVHKFKRPPKNERQFQGYRPTGALGQPPRGRVWRGWQKSLLAWVIVVLAAVAWWAIGKLL